ncbi:3',5'-cyclic adenosine monophosphate phosphodiesterase CpdA [Fundidesulfovibrio magnetotacticus]|uniref:3',5'-cyclic adenosine monophosphate phosphodiesterase CpdA n=1 Tax=Fundidesulfovibrio magnetotacticus TaxID=2730080 RepID=A0A6V8LYD3_9BACT|nr:metallophosphoesterase [Fundidesulfovibrio magnetotacticus]GFK94816.1 3',5'-cyclic adenosine monophosphate phosphodiesterase CpdA [Fundidesulfovibrio magnetotacticus]
MKPAHLPRVALLLLLAALWPGLAASAAECPRVAVLADIHFKAGDAKKLRAVDDLNDWPGLDLTVVLGDIVARRGTPEEYAQAREFVERIKGPRVLVAGNHEYMYADAEQDGKTPWGSPELRREKLERFRRELGAPQLRQARELGGYLLLFLSADAVDGTTLTELSPQSLDWLARTLRDHPATPTLIFFHAPLKGTLENYAPKINNKDRVAQPADALDAILRKNAQVIAWVSGHTHTKPDNPSFLSDVNRYEGRVANVHTPPYKGGAPWTNVFTLCPDKVTVKTWDHAARQWAPGLERVIPTVR